MTVTKILETTIASGGNTAIFTDSDIPNSLIRVYATNSNIYPQSVILSNNTLTITYENLTSEMGVAIELVKQGLIIDDTLDSDASNHALSALQGKNLLATINNLSADDIGYDNTETGIQADNVQDALDSVFTSVSNGKDLIADAITDKGVPTSANDSFADMAYNISQISGGGQPTQVSEQILIGGEVVGWNAGQASVNHIQSHTIQVILDLWLWCPDIHQAGTVYINVNGINHLVTDYSYYTYTDQYHAVRRYTLDLEPSVNLTSAGYSFSGLAYNTGSRFHGEITIVYEDYS